MATVELNVAGMTCDGCENSIKRALTRLDGVKAVMADHESGKVVLEAEGPLVRRDVEAAIEDAGYEVLPEGGKQLPVIS